MTERNYIRALVTVVASVGTLCAAATELFPFPGETLGITAPDLRYNNWHGGTIRADLKPEAQHFVPLTDLDFFTQEYGKPLAPFSFTVTDAEWTRWFGENPNDPQSAGCRFGRGWGAYATVRHRLEIEVEQSCDTAWRFRMKDFKIAGPGRRSAIVELSMIGDVSLYPNVNAKDFRLEVARMRVWDRCLSQREIEGL